MIMKKILGFILILCFITSCIGCSSKTEGTENVEAGKDSRLTVYTSFYTLYDFASRIGGEKVNVINLIPSATEPHDWEPTPRDMLSLEKADMLIYNGLGMESWIEKVTGALENKNIYLLEASNGIETIKGEDGELKNTDPHIWLSLRNAVIEMENIKNAFVGADSENKEYFEENFLKAKEEFLSLDKEYSEKLDSLSQEEKNIVVAHEAFAYLCKDYGLNQIPIEGMSADSEPEPSRISEIIKFAKDQNIKVIYFEELVSPKVANMIADEIGAKTAVLNPIEGLSEEQANNGEDYLSLMKKNLETLLGRVE